MPYWIIEARSLYRVWEELDCEPGANRFDSEREANEAVTELVLLDDYPDADLRVRCVTE